MLTFNPILRRLRSVLRIVDMLAVQQWLVRCNSCEDPLVHASSYRTRDSLLLYTRFRLHHSHVSAGAVGSMAEVGKFGGLVIPI